MALVIDERVGAAAVLTLDRADKRNALSQALIAELRRGFERARDDSQVRTVILTARGPVFCAGMDLGELQESFDRPGAESPVWDDALQLAQLYDLIYTLPKPTIAVVQGPAVAGGGWAGDGLRSCHCGGGGAFRLSRSAARAGRCHGNAALAPPRR